MTADIAYETDMIAERRALFARVPESLHGIITTDIAFLAERAAAKLARPGDPSDPLEAIFALPTREGANAV